jgi:hypothetical protein
VIPVKNVTTRMTIVPGAFCRYYFPLATCNSRIFNMKPPLRSYALLLPILDCIFSIALLLGMTGVYFYNYKHAANRMDKIYIGSADNGLVLQSRNFLSFSFNSAALWCLQPIRTLNAPGDFVAVLVSHAMARKPFWFPSSIGPAIWDCVTFPLFAVPAWWYVGRSIDRFRARKRIQSSGITIGAILVAIFATIASVLFLELRGDPGLVPGYTAGFTLWTFLVAVPFIARLWQRFAQH